MQYKVTALWELTICTICIIDKTSSALLKYTIKIHIICMRTRARGTGPGREIGPRDLDPGPRTSIYTHIIYLLYMMERFKYAVILFNLIDGMFKICI